jgi:hypothetical protein
MWQVTKTSKKNESGKFKWKHAVEMAFWVGDLPPGWLAKNVTSRWSQKTLVKKISGPSHPKQRIRWETHRLQSSSSRVRVKVNESRKNSSQGSGSRFWARWLRNSTRALVWVVICTVQWVNKRRKEIGLLLRSGSWWLTVHVNSMIYT